MSESSLRLAVGIATRGRADMLALAVHDLTRQILQPDRILVCGTDAADIGPVVGGMAGVDALLAPAGLPRQRNAILRRTAGYDVVLFLDDDFLLAPGYIAATAAAFAAMPALAVTTGTLIADDSRGPGLTFGAARSMIDADAAGAQTPATPSTGFDRVPHGYGCNMAIRMDLVTRHDIRFDERLPLYAWSEDIDFTHRMARHGWIAKLHGARGVHLGVKEGRTPGRRLGYSQVANPLYLFRKGSYSLSRAARSVGRNVAMNAARSLRPEPYIDRRGRLGGNALAMVDLLRGRLEPERVLDL